MLVTFGKLACTEAGTGADVDGRASFELVPPMIVLSLWGLVTPQTTVAWVLMPRLPTEDWLRSHRSG